MTAVRTPMNTVPAVALGHKLWRKQIIKAGPIHVGGKTFDATPEYLASVVSAFQDRAIRSVPFVFVDDKGAHSEAPERRKGNVVGLELAGDGVDAIVSLDDDADDLVAKDKRFGVSVLIKHDRTTGAGKHYPAVLAHVAGTYDPVLNNLGDWQEIAASHTDAGEEVIDLLALTSAFPSKENPVAEPTFTTEETALLRSLLAKFTADEPAEPAAPVVEPKPVAAEAEAEVVDELAEEADLTDAELDAMLTGIDEPELIAAGHEAGDDSLRLANELAVERKQREDADLRLAQVEAKLAERDYLSEREHLAREFGVAPRLTDIVRPLLLATGGGNKLALANGDTVDAGALVRQFVKELASTGFLDLSHAVGSAVDAGPDEEDVVAERKRLAAFAVQQLR